MNNDELYNICLNFRRAIETVKNEHDFHPKSMMRYFPRACCGNTTSLLRFYLKKEFDIETRELSYRYNGDTSHAFLMYDEFVIDLTADQFYLENRPPVYVDYIDDFYESMVYENEYPFYDFEMESKSIFPDENSLMYLYDYNKIIGRLR